MFSEINKNIYFSVLGVSQKTDHSSIKIIEFENICNLNPREDMVGFLQVASLFNSRVGFDIYCIGTSN